MASNTAQSLSLEEYSRLSSEKAFPLEVVVLAAFAVRGVVDDAQSAVTAGQVLLIGVPIFGNDSFQVATKEDGRFLSGARGADLKRCVAPTGTTRALASGQVRRTMRAGVEYESLLQLTQPIKCRSLSGEVKELLPGSYLHSGESSLLPNHVLVTLHHRDRAIQNAQRPLIIPRNIQVSLFQDNFLVAATGGPVTLDNQGCDFTKSDDVQPERYVAWESFEGCGVSCDSIHVQRLEEVTVFCKSHDSSALWCRNNAGIVFVHDPVTQPQVKLVKVTPPGVLNIELRARLQGIFDWPQQKVQDYEEASQEMQRVQGPHPLTWNNHSQCRACNRWFGRHAAGCASQTWLRSSGRTP